LSFGSNSTMSFVSIFSFITASKIAENRAEYSIQNTARQALFLSTNRQAKYKAKFAIDSFFARAGDGISALLVFMGTRFAFDIRSFAVVNAASVLVWLVVAVAILRIRNEQSESAIETPKAA